MRLSGSALGLSIIFLIGTAGAATHTGVFASDPHLVGNRDMNYDHLIVPGVRIGPVSLGAAALEAIQHLGEPDSVSRRSRGLSVDYYYDSECISFTWLDSGITPRVANGPAHIRESIDVTCGKWRTEDGLGVGSPLQDVISLYPEYCLHKEDDGSLLIMTKEGIFFAAKNRNSPVNDISVVTKLADWQGYCQS